MTDTYTVDTLLLMDLGELVITAELANLEPTEEELQRLGVEVDRMLEYFQRMSAVDTTDLKPTTHALRGGNRLRDDDVNESLLADDMLENAPELEDRFIVIPNVL